jgi:protein-S-isoprenylcysteine O-methyltransferase Ste14
MSFEIKVMVFVVVSAGFAWYTRSSLRSFRFHGLYRFFAIQSFLAVILLNLDYWFYQPFSPRQIVSWLLLTICVFQVIHGTHTLHVAGKPDKKRSDPSLIGIEKTTELVTEGAYRYIRHPIYSALLFGVWGAFFKHPSWVSGSLAVIATFFLTMTGKMEETENIRFWGAAYQGYMKQTRMFIPFIF